MASDGKKIVLITGANTGIGYETLRALLQSSREYHVLLGSRSLEKGNDAAAALKKEFPDSKSTVEVIQVDISSDESINAAFEKVKNAHGRVDCLLNNAGMTLEVTTGAPSLSLREIWNQTYDVNVSGTHVMTHVFAPLLIASSDPRLLFLTSGLAQLETMSKTYFAPPSQNPAPAGWPKPPLFFPNAYRSSKTALNMMMLTWHWTLKSDGVKVWSISPGLLATGLGGDTELLKRLGAGHPSIGGQLIRDVIEGQRDADVGKVVNKDGTQAF